MSNVYTFSSFLKAPASPFLTPCLAFYVTVQINGTGKERQQAPRTSLLPTDFTSLPIGAIELCELSETHSSASVLDSVPSHSMLKDKDKDNA